MSESRIIADDTDFADLGKLVANRIHLCIGNYGLTTVRKLKVYATVNPAPPNPPSNSSDSLEVVQSLVEDEKLGEMEDLGVCQSDLVKREGISEIAVSNQKTVIQQESVSKGVKIAKMSGMPAIVSIPFKRESISKETLFCIQSGHGSGHPKPYANCAGFFCLKICP